MHPSTTGSATQSAGPKTPTAGAATTQPTSTTNQNAWGSPAAESRWGVSPSSAKPMSLEEVMSEELAKQLQKEEESKSFPLVPPNLSGAEETKSETDSDLLLAQHLQFQYDQEHDALLKVEEEKLNGPSKVTVSYRHYKTVHPALESDEYSSEDEYLEAGYDEEKERKIVFTNGLSGKGKNIISKHDSSLSGRRNASRVMENFPPEFETGDGHKMNMRLPNHVYNKLKRHSNAEAKKAQRIHEKKERSTADMAIDEKTRLTIYKLVNRGILNGVHGVIATGKESVVLHADGGSMAEAIVPEECAIKVFKTTITDFKNRIQYVKGDVRYFKDDFKKHNTQRVIKIWAEKEDHNLRRLEHVGIRVPRCVILKKHVLVMEFIGKNHVAAPKLKDANLSFADLQIAYDQCIEMMKKMYHEARLVHADLSQYNLLWHNEQLYVIDVSQAVEVQHPLAMVFLLRDCENIINFFSNAGVPEIPSKYELFNDITGLGLDTNCAGDEFLHQIQEYEKEEEKLRDDKGKDFPFEYFFNKAIQERLEDKEKSAEGSDCSEEISSDEEQNISVPLSCEQAHDTAKDDLNIAGEERTSSIK